MLLLGSRQEGVGSPKKLSGWEETECDLEPMLCTGGKKGLQGENGIRGFGECSSSLPGKEGQRERDPSGNISRYPNEQYIWLTHFRKLEG